MSLTSEQQTKLDSDLDAFSAPVSAKERPVHPKVLLYGRPKVGKTTTASQLGDRPVIFSADGGWSALKDWPELAARVTVDEMQNLKHFRLWVNAVAEQTPRMAQFDHYIIDPMNVIQSIYTHTYLQRMFTATKQGENRTIYMPTRDGTAAGEESFTTAGPSDYNATLRYFSPLVFQLTRVPKMVTFICHAKEPGITERGNVSVPMRAALPGETYALFAQHVDFIGYMEADRGKINISVSPSAKEDAGSRIRALHGRSINANEYAAILNKWRAGELSNG